MGTDYDRRENLSAFGKQALAFQKGHFCSSCSPILKAGRVLIPLAPCPASLHLASGIKVPIKLKLVSKIQFM